MQFLALLVVVTFAAWVLPARFAGRSLRDASSRALAAGFLFTGVSHLAMPDSFLVYFPAWVPFPEAIVAATGAAEVAGGLALFARRWRRPAGRALAAYLVLVFPANVYAAVAGVDENLPGLVDAASYPWVRLPFQALFVWWALRSTAEPAPRGYAARGPQPVGAAR